MVLNKTTTIGEIKIEIPMDIHDSIVMNGTTYGITKFAIVGETVFAINPNYWFDISRLRLLKTNESGTKIFKYEVD